MSDIAALEGRITQALDRIRAGIEAASAAPQPAAGDDPDLRRQLDEERTANAQLEERVRALKERQDGRVAELEHQVDTQADQLAQLDAELQRLRASNADMRQISAQLRSAAADGVAEPELINRALMAEVEALLAQRSADIGEMDAILAGLAPILKEA